MIVSDSAPRGRNAQTLSELEGSSNRDAYNRRGIRVITFFSSLRVATILYISATRTDHP
jgi:hypothetical protein